MVRWFTRERHQDPNFDDDDFDAVRAAYWEYIDSVRDGLPPDLQRLARTDLHDAVFDTVKIDLVQRTAHFRLLSGDSSTFFDCHYADTDFGDSNLRNLEIAVEGRVPWRRGTVVEWRPFAAVVHDEIAVVAPQFRHSFLIDPLGDFAVSFREFRLTTEPAVDGRLPERNERFRVINQWSE